MLGYFLFCLYFFCPVAKAVTMLLELHMIAAVSLLEVGMA